MMSSHLNLAALTPTGRAFPRPPRRPQSHPALATPEAETTPAPPKRKRQVPDALTDDEVTRLLAVPNVRTKTGLRDRVLMTLLLFGGLRISEACDLTPDQVDLAAGWLHLRGTKGRKSRDLPISPNLRPWLEAWAGQRITSCPHFLHTVHAQATVGTTPGQRLNRTAAWKMIHRCALQAGVREQCAHPHSLRHTFASRILRQGGSIYHVQQLLGHSNISTTSIYLHVTPNELAELMNKIG